MKHAMLDLETASSNPNAAVLTIGALLFDPMGSPKDDEGMHFVVPFDMNKGRDITLDTIKWWMEQSHAARHAAWIEGRSGVQTPGELILNALIEIFDSVDDIWANDPDFDCVILKSFFAQHGVKWKWYRKHRSMRTLKAMYDIPFVLDKGTAHNALDDCKYQAEQVRAVYQALARPTFGAYAPSPSLSGERTIAVPSALGAPYGSAQPEPPIDLALPSAMPLAPGQSETGALQNPVTDVYADAAKQIYTQVDKME